MLKVVYRVGSGEIVGTVGSRFNVLYLVGSIGQSSETIGTTGTRLKMSNLAGSVGTVGIVGNMGTIGTVGALGAVGTRFIILIATVGSLRMVDKNGRNRWNCMKKVQHCKPCRLERAELSKQTYRAADSMCMIQ